jgi:uncharacterized protein YciI
MPAQTRIKLTDLNRDLLSEVVATARQGAAAHPHWLKAIEKADQFLRSHEGGILVDQDGTAHIPSATSTTVYSANGVCQCQAFQNARPCWHRAAARLLTRYREALEAKADQLMHAVEDAEQRGDWAAWDILSAQWAAVEAQLFEMV